MSTDKFISKALSQPCHACLDKPEGDQQSKNCYPRVPGSLQIKVLDGTPYEWLHEMLECFNNGDMHRYDQLCNQYADVLNSLPAMVESERNLREKITILSLTELIFKYALQTDGPSTG